MVEEAKKAVTAAPQTEYTFYCGKCRTRLLKGDAIRNHEALPRKKTGGGVLDKYVDCTSYFVEQQPWMVVPDYQRTGKLMCPNEKVTISPMLRSVDRSWGSTAGRAHYALAAAGSPLRSSSTRPSIESGC